MRRDSGKQPEKTKITFWSRGTPFCQSPAPIVQSRRILCDCTILHDCAIGAERETTIPSCHKLHADVHTYITSVSVMGETTYVFGVKPHGIHCACTEELPAAARLRMVIVSKDEDERRNPIKMCGTHQQEWKGMK